LGSPSLRHGAAARQQQQQQQQQNCNLLHRTGCLNVLEVATTLLRELSLVGLDQQLVPISCNLHSQGPSSRHYAPLRPSPQVDIVFVRGRPQAPVGALVAVLVAVTLVGIFDGLCQGAIFAEAASLPPKFTHVRPPSMQLHRCSFLRCCEPLQGAWAGLAL
jgi:hypothetical protein